MSLLEIVANGTTKEGKTTAPANPRLPPLPHSKKGDGPIQAMHRTSLLHLTELLDRSVVGPRPKSCANPLTPMPWLLRTRGCRTPVGPKAPCTHTVSPANGSPP